MNLFKTQEPKKQKKERTVTRSIIGILNGSFLTREEAIKHLPFLLFLTLLALIYIANVYNAQDTIRRMNTTSSELKEMRSEYITTKSELMFRSKQSEVARTIRQTNIGLTESTTPPKKIIVSKTDQTTKRN